MGWGPLKNKKERVECQQSSLLPGHSHTPVTHALSFSGCQALFIMTGCPLNPWAKISPSILAVFARSSSTAMRTVTHPQILVPFSFTRSLIKATRPDILGMELTGDGNQGLIPLTDTSAHANKDQPQYHHMDWSRRSVEGSFGWEPPLLGSSWSCHENGRNLLPSWVFITRYLGSKKSDRRISSSSEMIHGNRWLSR